MCLGLWYEDISRFWSFYLHSENIKRQFCLGYRTTSDINMPQCFSTFKLLSDLHLTYTYQLTYKFSMPPKQLPIFLSKCYVLHFLSNNLKMHTFRTSFLTCCNLFKNFYLLKSLVLYHSDIKESFVRDLHIPWHKGKGIYILAFPYLYYKNKFQIGV